MYYVVVEEAMTTVAHLVAFTVGAVALLLFEALHKIPRESSRDERRNTAGLSLSDEGISGTAAGSTPYEQLK